MTQIITRPAIGVQAKFFRGLGDPSRLAILTALREGESTVGEVATAARLSVSNTSRHLACLRDCGLVEARQEWRRVYYRLAPDVGEVLAVNETFIARVAALIEACTRPEMGKALNCGTEAHDD